MTFSEHNPLILTFKGKNGSFKWRLNEMRLKETIVEDWKKKLKGFLKNNLQ